MRDWLERPGRGPSRPGRGPSRLWFLRHTRRVRAIGRIESSPALPGASRVRRCRSRARRGQPGPRDAPAAALRSSVARTARVSRKNRPRWRSSARRCSSGRPQRRKNPTLRGPRVLPPDPGRAHTHRSPRTNPRCPRRPSASQADLHRRGPSGPGAGSGPESRRWPAPPSHPSVGTMSIRPTDGSGSLSTTSPWNPGSRGGIEREPLRFGGANSPGFRSWSVNVYL